MFSCNASGYFEKSLEVSFVKWETKRIVDRSEYTHIEWQLFFLEDIHIIRERNISKVEHTLYKN